MNKTNKVSDRAALEMYVGLRNGLHRVYNPEGLELVTTKHALFDETYFRLAKNVQESLEVVFNLENLADEEESYSEKRRSPLPQQTNHPARDSVKQREEPAKGTNKLVKKAVNEERKPEDVENVGEIPTVTTEVSAQEHKVKPV